MSSPIGIFDSGIGGLTVLKEIEQKLPQNDYIYLGDNARAPYGTRSFETVYHYTLECVQKLFAMNCRLVILACNTASAKALRTIQQVNLPRIDPARRVLGVIRPTAEVVDTFTNTKCIGVLGTTGTIQSDSYKLEIGKLFPGIRVFQQACPMLVPLAENNEVESPATDYFIRKYLDGLFAQSSSIDTIILGCTHYPLFLEEIEQWVPPSVKVISQGKIVADSLADYLSRHPEIESKCRISRPGTVRFFTTDDPENFDKMALRFLGREIRSEKVET